MFCPACTSAERGNVARVRARLGVVVGVLLAWSVCVLGFPGVASARWSVQATPKTQEGDTLYGVSCVSKTACIAVGGPDTAFSGGPIAERWNGRAWLRQPLPGVGYRLDGVTCPSRTDCVAVGGGAGALVELWNGKKWSVQRVPNPKGSQGSAELYAVSCPSTNNCFAVGSWLGQYAFVYPLLERWNGSKWSIQPTAEPFGAQNSIELTSVSCTSPSACTAMGVGNYVPDLAVAERWNGHYWYVQTPPVPNNTFLSAVSCPLLKFCVAVGDWEASDESMTTKLMLDVWNGRGWSGLRIENGVTSGDELNGVSCISASACLAVGKQAEQWNGRQWSAVPATFLDWNSPSPGAYVNLNAVSCTSQTACEAVGDLYTANDNEYTRAVRWTS